jgi:hypothetical protein
MINSTNFVNTIRVNQRESLIKAIFFCEFHPTAGPKIIYQVFNHYFDIEISFNIKIKFNLN